MAAGYPISIELSEDLYERVEQVARRTGQPIETVLLEGMIWWYNNVRADNVDAALKKLRSLSDVQLWAVVYQRLPEQEVEQLHLLLQKGNEGRLTEAEKAELESLVRVVDYQTLLRSEALLLLKQRGYEIDSYLR